MKSLLYVFCGIALLAPDLRPVAAYGGVSGPGVPPVPPVPWGPLPPPHWMAPWGQGAVPREPAQPPSQDVPGAPGPEVGAIRRDLDQRERSVGNECRRNEALTKERNQWRAEVARLRSMAADPPASGLAYAA